MVLTSVFAESVGNRSAALVVWKNVAVSPEPLGGPPAVQLPALFQSLLTGTSSHAALPATAAPVMQGRSSAAHRNDRNERSAADRFVNFAGSFLNGARLARRVFSIRGMMVAFEGDMVWCIAGANLARKMPGHAPKASLTMRG